jgi:ferrochelatase
VSGEGVLLVNTGTPDAPEPAAVRRFLAEFLSDGKVLDIPAPIRWLLLRLVILRRRPAPVAEAYRRIWTDEGSPLLVHGRALASGVAEALDAPVELAMRYGEPSVRDGLRRLLAVGADGIAVLPLFPQHAEATTGTTVAHVKRVAARLPEPPALRFVEPFYADPSFLDAWAGVARPVLAEANADRVLMSFHGLPVRQVRAADPSGRRCLVRPDCCDAVDEENRRCYRAHCFATARGIAARLALPEDGWEVAFQSRLGRAEWLAPDTAGRIRTMPGEGVRSLAVLAPSFVADCLETLEELGLRGTEAFREAGGEELILVPSLNASPDWVAAVANLVR